MIGQAEKRVGTPFKKNILYFILGRKKGFKFLGLGLKPNFLGPDPKTKWYRYWEIFLGFNLNFPKKF